MHLGKKTAPVIAEHQARKALARLDVPPVDNPLEALGKVAGEVIAWKDVLADRVNELTSLRYSTESGEQLRAEVVLWERALDRCERFLSAMARHNVDERIAALNEEIARRQGAVIAEFVSRVLARLELTAEQKALVPAVVREECRVEQVRQGAA